MMLQKAIRTVRSKCHSAAALLCTAAVLLTSVAGAAAALSFAAVGGSTKTLYDFDTRTDADLTDARGFGGDNVTLSLNKDGAFSASGNSLKAVLGAADATVTVTETAGAFTGTALRFYAAATADVTLSEVRYWYTDSKGTATYASQTVGQTAESGETRTVAYNAAALAVLDRTDKVELVLSGTAGAALYLDDIVVEGHVDEGAPTAQVSLGSATAQTLTFSLLAQDNDTAVQDLQAEAYYSLTALKDTDLPASGEQPADGIFTGPCGKGLTAIPLTGLRPGTDYYLAVRLTDEAGNATVVTASAATPADDALLYTGDSKQDLTLKAVGAAVSVNKEAAFSAAGNSAKVVLKGETASVYLYGSAGDFAGKGLSAWYRADAGIKHTGTVFYTRKADGSLKKAASSAADTALDGTGTLAVTYPAAQAQAKQIAAVQWQFAGADNAALYLDNVQVTGATDCVAPVAADFAAAEKNGKTTFTWTLTDRQTAPADVAVTALLSAVPVTESAVHAYRAGNESGTMTVLAQGSGLTSAETGDLIPGRYYELVVLTADKAGNEGTFTFVYQPEDPAMPETDSIKRQEADGPATLIEDYESAAAEDVAETVEYTNMSVAIVDVDGNKKLRFHEPAINGYPHFVLKGAPGDFNGSGISFEWKSSTDTNFGMHGLMAYYIDRDGSPKAAWLRYCMYDGVWQETFPFRSGETVTLTYNSFGGAGDVFTDEMIAGIYKFDFYTENHTPMDIYVDDLKTIGYKDTVAGATATVANNGDVTLNWTLGTRKAALGDYAIEVYASSTALTKADVEGYTGDTATLKKVADGAAMTDVQIAAAALPDPTINYFAVKATENGHSTYAFAMSRKVLRKVLYDFESSDSTEGIAGEVNMGTLEVASHNSSRMLHMANTSKIGYPNVYLYLEPGAANGEAVSFYYENNAKNAMMDRFDLMWRDVDGNSHTKEIGSYFSIPSGSVYTVDLTGLTDEQRAGLYGIHWYYGSYENSGDFDLYIDDVTVVGYKDGIFNLDHDQNETTGDVTASWELGTDQNELTDYTVEVYAAAQEITPEMVAAYQSGTDTTTIRRVTAGKGLTTATVTDVPRYTTNYFGVWVQNGQGDTAFLPFQETEEKYVTIQDFEGLTSLKNIAGQNAMNEYGLVTESDNTYLHYYWDEESPWGWCSSLLYFQPGDLAGAGFRMYLENPQNCGINNAIVYYTDSNGEGQSFHIQDYFTPADGKYLSFTFPEGMSMADRAAISMVQFVWNAQVGVTKSFNVNIDNVQVRQYQDTANDLKVTYDENEDNGNAHLSWQLTNRLGNAADFDVRVFAQKNRITVATLENYLKNPAASSLKPFATGTGITSAVYPMPEGERYQDHYYVVVAFDPAGTGNYVMLKNAELPYRNLYNFEQHDTVTDYKAYTSGIGGHLGIYVNADGAYGVREYIRAKEDVPDYLQPFVTGHCMELDFTTEIVSAQETRWPGLTLYAPNYGDFAGEGLCFTFAKTPNDDGVYRAFECQVAVTMEDGSQYATDTWSSPILSADEDGKNFVYPYTAFWRTNASGEREYLTPELSENIIGTWMIIQAPNSYGHFHVYMDSVKVYNPYTVTRPLTDIVFSNDRVAIKPNGMYTPDFTVVPKNTTMAALRWTSSNEKVATVADDGVVTAVAKGSSVITATGANGVSKSYKVVVKESTSGVYRILADFDDGNMPAALTSTYAKQEMDFVHVDERNAVVFSGKKGGTVTFKAEDFQFYGDGLGMWVYSPQGGSATLTLTTAGGKKFSAAYPIDNDEGDFSVLSYTELKQNGKGAKPTAEDIIDFKTMTLTYSGKTLYFDSLKVRNPRLYNKFNPPKNEPNTTNIKVVPQKTLDADKAAYWANFLEEDDTDYGWATELLTANNYYTGPEDVKLMELYFLDEYYQEKNLKNRVTVTLPIPAALSGMENIWVIRLNKDGKMEGIESENDLTNLTFRANKSGVYALWMRYDTVGLYYKLKQRKVVYIDDDPTTTVVTDPVTPTYVTDPTTPPVDPTEPTEPTEPVLPAGVLAQGACGADAKWTLYDDGEIVISGTGDMYDYDDYAPWADYLDKIRYVTVLDGVTSVGNCAFYGCPILEDVLLPASVTRLGSYAFFQCEKLKQMTVPATVTDIGEFAIGYTADAAGNFSIVDGFVLYGTPGTAAETYATDYKLAFNGNPEDAPVIRDGGGLPWWGWTLIGVGGVAVLGGAVLLIILLAKKKKQQPDTGAAE